MLHNWVERADQLFIASFKTIFFVIGVFGNSCFIFIVIRNQNLQSKSSFLQCIQCLFHIICLLGTLVDVGLAIQDVQLDRTSCFHIMIPFVFFEAAQAVIMLELVLDIYIIVKLPVFYKKIETYVYLLVALVAPFIIGAIFASWGFTNLDDEEIYFCSPTSYIKLPRRECYPLVSIYTFFETAQSMIMLLLVLDILIIVQRPRFYHTFSTTKYICLCLIPAILCGILFFVWGFLYTDDELVIFCNPPLGLNITASTWFFRYILFLNMLTLIVFLVLIRIFYAKGRAHRGDSWKVMKRLQLSVVIFVCSWFIAQSANSVFLAMGITGETFNFLCGNVAFFVLLSFSQTFYVIIWKSKEYRQHFISIWCSRSIRSADVTSSVKTGPIGMVTRTF
uniref:G_PROTEIN_RECEP_F1_2 domain-containing protein n=1 Tax=Caenorhabditis tropicalis TaxID=1561998 RepID=A0A1I7SZQ2_9PELO